METTKNNKNIFSKIFCFQNNSQKQKIVFESSFKHHQTLEEAHYIIELNFFNN